jgi:PAS domain-containing protein
MIALSANIMTAIWIYDIDGSFISGNPAFMKAIGKDECDLQIKC